MTKRTKRGCGFYFIYLIFMFIVCFLICEIGLRIFWTPPRFHTDLFRNDPAFHFFTQSNKKGEIKDSWMRPILKRQSPEEYRIFLLGDGFAHGMVDTKEEAFCSMIEKEFNRRNISKKAVVYNMAMPPYSPLIHFLIVKNLVLQNDPDLVIMMVDSTDPQDDSLYELQATLNENSCPVSVNPTPNYENLLLKMEMALPVLMRLKKNKGRWEIYEQEPGHRFSHYKDPYRFWAPAFRKMARYITMSGNLLNEANVPLVLVHLPYPVVLQHKDSFEAWLTRWGFFKEATYTGKNMNLAIWDAAIRAHAQFLNLEPYVLEMEKQVVAGGGTADLMYRPKDGYFTALANQEMAVEIVSFLLKSFPELKESEQ